MSCTQAPDFAMVCTTSPTGGEPSCRPKTSDDEAAEPAVRSSQGLDPPMRVVVIQRTVNERRIINLDKLLDGLKRKLSSANFTTAGV